MNPMLLGSDWELRSVDVFTEGLYHMGEEGWMN